MGINYNCYVFVTADREILDEIICKFDPNTLQAAEDVEIEDRERSIRYVFQSEDVVDLDRVKMLSARWPDANVEVVWINAKDEVGFATLTQGAVTEKSDAKKFMLICVIKAGLMLGW